MIGISPQTLRVNQIWGGGNQTPANILITQDGFWFYTKDNQPFTIKEA